MRINPPFWVFASAFVSALLAAAPMLRAAGPDFEARVGGRALELHGFAQGAFGLFETTGPVDVDIRTGFDVRWVTVRPLSAGISASIAGDHHSVHFKATGTTPLTIEFNDDLSRVVHLFPYGPESGV